MSERLKFRRLLLLAPAGEYPMLFHGGVNVIAGPFGTGKSSTLMLLDYACGARLAPDQPELSKCTDLLVEMEAGGEIITVQRPLRAPSATARIYAGPIPAVKDGSAEFLEVASRHVSGQASLSSELLKRLGLGNIETKTAPSQIASDTSTFSIRDLMHLLYVDQERMVSKKNAFFEAEFPKAIKLRAGFEIVHGLYNQDATARAAALQEAEEEALRIERFLADAQRFLDQARVPSLEEIDTSIREADRELAALTEQTTKAHASGQEQLGDNRALLQRRNALAAERATIGSRTVELNRTLTQLGRLRVQYDRERAQLEFLEESKALVGSLPVVRCPNCLQGVFPNNAHETTAPALGASPAGPSTATVSPLGVLCYVCHRLVPPENEEVSFAARLRAVQARIRDLEHYLGEVAAERNQLDARQMVLGKEVAEIDGILSRVEQTSMLPHMQAIMELGQASTLVEQHRRQLVEHRGLRERARGEGSNLLAVRERIRRLRDEQDAAAPAPSPENVVSRIRSLFEENLRLTQFPFLWGVDIDSKSYMPIVRDQPYRSLQSPGAIAMVSSAWHLAVLRYALANPSRFPMLLIFDSPLSHVGHDTADHDFRDQRIVDAYYEFLGQLHREHGSEFQFIMCTNRPPGWIDEAGMLAERFTGRRGEGRVGLVSDEYPAERDAAVPDAEHTERKE